ncbi:hypothetical protein [Carboxylicivirga linearis]|uniref:Uncharacterized protein n=1 Tax=Carboxylicivirga linearis TaxID=1628157 RepID=A0ABS5K401_9BACT|nr:hypothetical protein [Carboxylicivirga linearis]MBS2101214.1 hypothetical protein [Carboxylicivirga linearis]
MNELPEEFELMSFFEVEPIKADKDSDVPFYYNILTYVIKSDLEKIEIIISPSYGDIEIFWEQNNILKFNWRFYDIETLKIEKRDNIECMKITFDSENMSDCFLWVKPSFKIIGGMNITH